MTLLDEIKDKADLERFIRQAVEQRPMNTVAGLTAKIAELEARLKKGGL